MRTKQMRAFILAAIFAFESMVAGYGSVNVHAQTVTENGIKEAVETVQTAPETVDAEAENVKSETADIEVETVESEMAVAEEDIASETATVSYNGTDGDLDWSIDTDGHLTISGNGDYTMRTPNSATGWLAHRDEIKSATVNVSGITDTSYMFYRCSNLENVDVSGFDTRNVKNMSSMFSGCKSLTGLDVSGFDTSQVKDMYDMFYECFRLTSLDVSGFNTSQVKDMQGMFGRCVSLTSLDVIGFDTSQVTDMSYMFYYCESLTSLDVTGFDTGQVTDMSYMFYYCESLTSLDVTGFDTGQVTDMNHMFDCCISLTSLDMSGLDTSRVNKMKFMFYCCESLTSLDMSGLDTSQVTDMGGMFISCKQLHTIHAPENRSSEEMTLPTNTNASWIYQPTGETVTAIKEAGTYVRVCGGTDGALSWSIDTDGHLTVSGNGDYKSRTSESQSGWMLYKDEIKSATVNVSGITDTSYMFYACSNLESLDLSGLDTRSVTNMSYMFAVCNKLHTIHAPENKTQLDMDLPIVENCTWIYQPTGEAVTAIKEEGTYLLVKYSGVDGQLKWNINLDGHLTVSGNGDYEKRTQYDSDMGWLAYKDEIKSATVNVTGITNTSCMFYGCSNLESVDLKNLDTSNVTDMSYMFSGCNRLTDLDVSTFQTDKVENMKGMFGVCNSLTSLNLKGFDTSKVTNMYRMFYNCQKLESLDLSGFKTGNVTNMSAMFMDCIGLTELKLDKNNFNTANVADMSSMFNDCSSLTSLDVSGFKTSGVLDMENMFYCCESLTSLDLSNFNTTNVTNMNYMFGYCYNLTSLDISNFNTTNVTNMSGMFADCYSLTSLDISKFNTENVANMYNMFCGCSSLTSLDISNFNTVKVTNMSGMFVKCNNLNTIYAPENKTQLDIDMELPTVANCTWIYQPTGETVIAIKEAGTYLLVKYSGVDGQLNWNINLDGHLTVSGNGDYEKRGWGEEGERAWTGETGWLAHKTEIKSATVNVSGITDASYMFYGCSNLTSLDMSGLNTANVTDMTDMFAGCNKLHTIYAPENKSTVDMKLPVEEDCTWTHVPTGEYVTVVKKAGTYVKGAVVKDESNQEEEKPVVGDNTDPEEEKPVVGDKPEPEEKKPVVEKDTETKKDGSVVTTEKTTYPEGNVSMTIISTSKDKKKQTRVDMEIDAQKNLTSAAIDVSKKISKKTMTINLKELKKMVDQIEKCNVEYVHPLADGSEAETIFTEDGLSGSTEIVSIEDGLGGSTEGTSVAGISPADKSQDGWTDGNITWADELYVTAKKANISIKVTAKDNKGKDKYSLSIQKKDLTQKKFVVYGSDKKGSPVMTNPKSNYVKVNAKKDMTIKIASKGNYQLQNKKDAAKTNQKIMKTVTPAKTKVTVKPGSSTKFALSAKCNKANISKITYKADNSKVSVAKSGKISAKSSGTAKVTANVTMKNGAKKSIKMKVSVS